MRPGTPSFVGARLREAREARGLTAVALSELLGVTRSAVSQYESGKVTPHPTIVHQLVEVLKLPVDFFLRPVEERSAGTIFFRSLSAASKTARTRAAWRYEWLSEIVKYLAEFVEFPEVNLPEFDLPTDPTAISDDDIEQIATQTRRFWALGDGPISNVVRLLEKNGVIVARIALDSDVLDGFSVWTDTRPWILLAADKASAVRSRFDAAHELAHLVMHRNVERKFLTRAPELKLIERQAHRFAGAFLLPERSFVSDLLIPTLGSFALLKPKWVVSIAMMIKRARDLGLLSEEEYKRLWVSYSRRGWSKKEPLDDQLLPEEPHLLRLAFDVIISKRVRTRAEIRSALPYSTRDIEELAGLPEGYLDDPPLEVRRKVNEEGSAGPARVIEFPGGRTQGSRE